MNMNTLSLCFSPYVLIRSLFPSFPVAAQPSVPLSHGAISQCSFVPFSARFTITIIHIRTSIHPTGTTRMTSAATIAAVVAPPRAWRSRREERIKVQRSRHDRS